VPNQLVIRCAEPSDVPEILSFIRELAEYERLAHEVEVTDTDLHNWLFGARPVAEVLIAEYAGEPAGFALFLPNFSTFVGKPGIYLEDLYVRPEFRGKGLGKSLLKRVIRIAYERNCGRVEWAVLDWNLPAIDFYRSLGARSMSDWTVFRLDAEAIRSLADPEA
jgi:GNAT superfamily N-acetyltransferase